MPNSTSHSATKLQPHIHRGQLLPRPRLQRYISDIENHLLATVIAPAGYGKTSLLGQYYLERATAGAHVAWLTIDQSDNDIARFIDGLVHALRVGHKDVGESVLRLLNRRTRPSPEALMTTLINEVAALNHKCFVFLDDFHLTSNSELLDTLSTIFLRSPPNLRWIIAARTVPLGLPLGRLRALGQLIEIRDNDLRFTVYESAEFVEKCMKLELACSEVKLLNKRTEGWIAGLQLASLSLGKVSNRRKWIDELSGEYRNIAEFLADEVLRNQDKDTREFLLRTSILSRLHRDLCSTVTQMKDCNSILEHVISSRLFISSLDETDDWYRFHHLFAEFLERRLHERHPDFVPVLHTRASQWLEEHGFHLDAIHHACKAQDFERAVELLEFISEPLFSSGQVATLEYYAALIPQRVLEGHPKLLLDLAWQHILIWDFSEGRRVLKNVRRGLAATRADTKFRLSREEIEYLAGKLDHREMMLSFISDDLARTEEKCIAWLTADYRSDPAMHMLTSVKIILQAARRNRFEVGDTMALASAVHDICVEHKVLYGSIYHDCLVGITLSIQGELDKAETCFKNGLTHASELYGQLSPLTAMPGLLLAELCYERNRLDEARTHINEHIQNCIRVGIADQLIAGYVTKTRLLAQDGNFGAAIETLNEGDKHAIRFDFNRLQAHLAGERIRLYLLTGERKLAMEIGRRNGLLGPPTKLKPGPGATTATLSSAISWTRLARHRGDLDGAVRLLKQWWGYVTERACWKPAVGIGVQLSKLMAENGDQSAARRHLSETMSLYNAQGFIRTCLDEGPIISKLLGEIDMEITSKPGMAVCTLQKALNALSDADNAWPFDTKALQIEVVLKEREVEILELAADDRSNSEIASRLALSTNTVKWYWQQIFSKFDVNRRGTAVRKARDQGLIL
ncbi:MAG: LuxR C-terminal-related transcriptional regulator [Gammaproteobacteria bacterium]|nr:LuxR C-terminal-related transcriptional regulator [Gammaproteobacteria bacterium]